ncbi:MAG: thymidine kinase [Planctomycetota bacterium]
MIRGCMFAGKTARLIGRLREAQAGGRRVLALKHRVDARYRADELATHDGQSFPAVAVGDVAEAAERIRQARAEVVGIDEAQFFGRGLAAACAELRAGGCVVITAGIHHDAWGQDFPPLPELAAIADEVESLSAACTLCGAPAEFTQRSAPLAGPAPLYGPAHPVLVGGPAEYEPRCARCFVPLPGPKPVY